MFNKSAPGWDSITYYHLNHLPSAHHFIATLFNKLLEKGVSPACWGSAHIKLIYKAGDPSDPSSSAQLLLPLLLRNSLYRLEDFLIKNNVIDITGLPGVFEHVYSLSAILQDASSFKKTIDDHISRLEKCVWLSPTQPDI